MVSKDRKKKVGFQSERLWKVKKVMLMVVVVLVQSESGC